MVGVNVYVWPVAKIEGRNGDGGRIVVIVIAAGRVGRHICEEFIASALSAGATFDHARFRRCLARRIGAGSGANCVKENSADIGDKTGQGPGRARDMKYRLVLERIAANHVHVDVDTQPLPDLRMAGEKRHRSLDLRPPDKAQCPFGARQLTRADQMRQHARGFKNGGTATSVIVRTRTLTEVAVPP